VQVVDIPTGAPCSPAVHIVEDDAGFRAALDRLLSSEGYEVRQFGSVQEFSASGRAGSPGCLVLDVRLPGGVSGLDLQARLLASGNSMPVIFMTGHGDIPMSVRAMKAGAVDFFSKPVREQDMLDAVASAMAQDAAARARRVQVDRLCERLGTLSARERDVMRRVANGKMNKQIATELSLAEITVKIHRGNAMRKMGARTVIDLVRMAEILGSRIEVPAVPRKGGDSLWGAGVR